MAFALECDYELHVDAHWFQGNVECQQKWNTSSLTLKGNPLYNFGIQTPFIANLSPALMISKYIESDKKVVFQIMVEAFMIYFLLQALFKSADTSSILSEVLAFISSIIIWIPSITGNAMTAQITLGLYWQEIAIHSLFAVYLLKLYTMQKRKSTTAICAVGIISLIIYSVLVFPMFSPFFILCHLFGVASLFLFSTKTVKIRIAFLYGFIGLLFIAAKIHLYVIYLFKYTREGFFDYESKILRACWLNNPLLQIPYLSVFSYPGLGNIFAKLIGITCLAGCVFNVVKSEKLKTECTYLLGAWLAGLAFTAKWLIFGGSPASSFYFELVNALIFVFIAIRLWVGLFEKQKLVSDQKTVMCMQAIGLLIIYSFAAHEIQSTSKREHFSKWPPAASAWTEKIKSFSEVKPADIFKGKCLVLLNMKADTRSHWGPFYNICANKIRASIGSDLNIDLMHEGIPLFNEYGHFMSPSFLSMFCLFFYNHDDKAERASRSPRVYNPEAARLLGISSVISDAPLKNEELIMSSKMNDHDIYLYQIKNTNLGTYSPTKIIQYRSFQEFCEQTAANTINYEKQVFLEEALEDSLVPAEKSSIQFDVGPAIRIKAESRKTSLIVLPFDFSYCLRYSGSGNPRLIPANLGCTGILFEGKIDGEISFQYSIGKKNINMRKKDIKRCEALGLSEYAPGRVFCDNP